MRIWTREKIHEGFKRFISENGRLPTSFEIDDMPDLPSARQIQRAFGGLPKIREELGYGEINFTVGQLRNAGEASRRGLLSEQALEIELIKSFGEPYVHTEKRFGSHQNRVDFMVFTQEGNFGIDIFNAGTLRGIQNNLNIKIPHYDEFPTDIDLYFVCANPSFTEEEVVNAVRNMGKLRLRPNITVTNLDGLNRILSGFTRHNLLPVSES